MISLYENDRREIPTSTAKLFADFFNVSVDYLLGTDTINSGDIKETLIKCTRKAKNMV